MGVQSIKELDVYRKAYGLAMRVYELSSRFPQEERFALTCQIRRCSRSVCQNLREAWAKRRYEAHFVSKLSDCDGENAETDTCLDFARDCGYITLSEHSELVADTAGVGRMLGAMLKNPAPFILNSAPYRVSEPSLDSDPSLLSPVPCPLTPDSLSHGSPPLHHRRQR